MRSSLGWDPAPVLKALERRNIPAQVTVDLRTQRIPFPDGNKRATRLYVALSVVVLIAIAGILYEWHFAELAPTPVSVSIAPPAPRSVPEPAVAAPVEPDAAVPTASASATESGATSVGTSDGGRIQLEFQKESWVEIKDRGGRTLLSQLNPAGTQKVVEGTPPFSVIIGNATNVRVTYNDAPVDLRPYVKIEVARFTLE